jgi:O-antigen biosynthesis protein WbqV
MGHVGKIATHVLLAFLALLVGRYLVIDMPFTRDTLLQATPLRAGSLIVELLFRSSARPGASSRPATTCACSARPC